MTARTAFYSRSIDYGHGQQIVEAFDGVITRQQVIAHQGFYSGDGNPELIGQPVKALRGMGFRKVRETSREYDMWMESSISDAVMD